MSILHTVNKSGFERNSLDTCLGHVKSGDAVLLMEDGVISARQGGAVAEKLTAVMADVAVYVLSADMAARGLTEDKLVDGIKAVDYAGFVDLATENDVVQAWL